MSDRCRMNNACALIGTWWYQGTRYPYQGGSGTRNISSLIFSKVKTCFTGPSTVSCYLPATAWYWVLVPGTLGNVPVDRSYICTGVHTRGMQGLVVYR